MSARASATSATTLPRGRVGPGFNDDFGDTFGIIYGFTADGFNQRELRDTSRTSAPKLLQRARRVEDRDPRRAGRTDLRRVLHPELANLGLDRSAVIAALQAQNMSARPATIQTGDENLIAARFRRVPVRAGHSRRPISPSMAGWSGSATSPTVRRGFADPPQPMFRVNGEPAIGLAIAMRDGGDILALGKNVKAAMDAVDRRPAARHRGPSRRRSGAVVEERDQRLHATRCRGGRDHPRRQLHQRSASRAGLWWRWRSR